MFIDIHAHAYLFPGPPQDGTTVFCRPEEVLRRYDELGIARGVLLPLIGPEVYLPQSNEEILEICRLYPDRFIPFCYIDPRAIRNRPDTDFTVWLNWYREKGVLGVGELMPNLRFDDPKVLNLLSQLEMFGWPVIFDSTDVLGEHYGLVDDPGLPQLEAILRDHPKLIILGHGPMFWREIAPLDPTQPSRYPLGPVKPGGAVPRLLRQYPNLHGDLSAGSGFTALERDPEHAARFLEEFQDRLYFGTDICTFKQPLPLAAFLTDLRDRGKISARAFRRIAYENAEQLLSGSGI